ncbi:Uncharacterized conserved protein, DUF2252 family [Methylobacterium sp. UNC378MF]|uniref:DUF2252 family protein n=1 Tax=Methylobacterium sp. UNC378MF TaxID=1502748 RepID=UPI00089000B1|nr:DUF2252 family protein [Methylobacterium sp. UNC378MF]SDA10728.1 Uncharacterized conserved protein, DUF2252 family [Methylobacterium sp. UNC378MF]
MEMQVPARSGRDASVLNHRRLCKIASSPHAYVRGSTARFYELIAGMPAGALPEGPPVWICGDAHLGNLGAVAAPDGRIDIQIRDLDQTVVANPAFDLVRLALSLVTAALNATLPGIVTARMMDAMADGYADGIADPEGAERDLDPSEIVVTTKRRALGRRWRHLSRERLKGKAARLPRGSRFFDLDAEELDAVAALIRDPEVRRLVLALGGAATDAEIRLLDAAYWIKGCSSLGRLRYAGLVEVLGGDRPQLALLDVKEAVPHLAPAAAGIAVPDDHAERVVAGARALSPNLGDRMVAGHIRGTPVTVRELMPQDLKIDAEQFSRGEAVRVSRHLAAILGRAHGRQMGEADRRTWIDAVRTPGPGPDAPGWLWSAVTDLMGAHQRGYLEHCHRIAREEREAA